MPSASPEMTVMTFAPDWSTFALTGPIPPLVLIVVCFQDCISKVIFYLLLWFFWAMLQSLDPICLKSLLKAMLLTTADLGAMLLTASEQKVCSTFIFQAHLCIEVPNVLATLFAINCWSSSIRAWTRLIFSCKLMWMVCIEGSIFNTVTSLLKISYPFGNCYLFEALSP